MNWNSESLTLQHRTLYEIIADSLEEMILNDKEDLQRLPTEHVLAQKFGVSRTVIREALKLLRERGLVKMRAGDGLYATRPQPSSMSQAMNRIIRFNDISDWDVYQVRILVECAACEMAFDNIGEAEINELSSLVDDMIKYKEDIDIRVRKDCEFHCAIARFSRNPLLASFVESIIDLLFDFMKKRIAYRPNGNDEGIEWHNKLINCFKNSSAKIASDLMKEHIMSSYNQLGGKDGITNT